MKNSMKWMLKRLPVFLFILAMVFSTYTAYHYSHHILDSDAASELVLNSLLVDQNKLVTPDWFYSSEIRFFNTNLIYMPLLKLFPDWQTVRFISIIVFQLLLVISYFYLSRKIKIKMNAFFLSASLMLLPLNVVYGRCGLYHNHYTPCFIYSFLIAGLFLSYIDHRGGKHLYQALRFFGMLLLSFISCMNGFRQFPAVIIPLFLTTLIFLIREHSDVSNTLAEIPKQSLKNFGLASLVFFSGFVGLVIYAVILPRYFHFQEMSASLVTLPSLENFRNLFVSYFSLFGFQEGRALFSVEGIMALSGLVAAVVLLIISLDDIIPRKPLVRFAKSFMAAFYPIAILGMTAIFLISWDNPNYTQYYLPAFVWIFPYLGIQIDHIPSSIKQIKTKHLAIILVCFCLLSNGIFNNFYYLNPHDKQVKYDIGLEVDTLNQLQGAIDFINENELELGYADYWLTNIITEATDGRVTMIPISYDNEYHVLVYFDLLTSPLFREKEFVEDKSVFIITNIPQSSYFGATELSQYSVLAYQDDNYWIYIFDFPTEVWEHLNY